MSKRSERLVGEQNAGALQPRADDSRALLLAAGERRRALQGAVGDADALQRLQSASPLGGGEPAGQAAPGRHTRQGLDQHVGQHRPEPDAPINATISRGAMARRGKASARLPPRKLLLGSQMSMALGVGDAARERVMACFYAEQVSDA
jgi:hypothetical protein